MFLPLTNRKHALLHNHSASSSKLTQKYPYRYSHSHKTLIKSKVLDVLELSEFPGWKQNKLKTPIVADFDKLIQPKNTLKTITESWPIPCKTSTRSLCSNRLPIPIDMQNLSNLKLHYKASQHLVTAAESDFRSLRKLESWSWCSVLI